MIFRKIIFILFLPCSLLAESLDFVVDFCSFPRENDCMEQDKLNQTGLKFTNYEKIKQQGKRLLNFSINCPQRPPSLFIWSTSFEYLDFQEMGCQSFGTIFSYSCDSTEITNLFVKAMVAGTEMVYCDSAKLIDSLANVRGKLFKIRGNISTYRIRQSRKKSESGSDYPQELNGSIEFKGRYVGECESAGE